MTVSPATNSNEICVLNFAEMDFGNYIRNGNDLRILKPIEFIIEMELYYRPSIISPQDTNEIPMKTHGNLAKEENKENNGCYVL